MVPWTCACFPPPASVKPRKVYNILVPDVFPSHPPKPEEPLGQGIKRKVAKLGEYVEMNPSRIGKVSRRLTRKIHGALRDQEFGYVKVAVYAYCHLLDKSSDRDSTYTFKYFSKELVHEPDTVIRTLLTHNRPEIQTLGAELLTSYIKAQDAVENQLEYVNLLIAHVVRLATASNSKGGSTEALQLECLKTIQSYILFCHQLKILPTLLEEIEAAILTHVDLSHAGATATLVQSQEEVGWNPAGGTSSSSATDTATATDAAATDARPTGAVPTAKVSDLALDILKQFQPFLQDISTVYRVIEALFKYLDQGSRWEDSTLVQGLIGLIKFACGEQTFPLFTALLRHSNAAGLMPRQRLIILNLAMQQGNVYPLSALSLALVELPKMLAATLANVAATSAAHKAAQSITVAASPAGQSPATCSPTMPAATPEAAPAAAPVAVPAAVLEAAPAAPGTSAPVAGPPAASPAAAPIGSIPQSTPQPTPAPAPTQHEANTPSPATAAPAATAGTTVTAPKPPTPLPPPPASPPAANMFPPAPHYSPAPPPSLALNNANYQQELRVAVLHAVQRLSGEVGDTSQVCEAIHGALRPLDHHSMLAEAVLQCSIAATDAIGSFPQHGRAFPAKVFPMALLQRLATIISSWLQAATARRQALQLLLTLLQCSNGMVKDERQALMLLGVLYSIAAHPLAGPLAAPGTAAAAAAAGSGAGAAGGLPDMQAVQQLVQAAAGQQRPAVLLQAACLAQTLHRQCLEGSPPFAALPAIHQVEALQLVNLLLQHISAAADCPHLAACHLPGLPQLAGPAAATGQAPAAIKQLQQSPDMAPVQFHARVVAALTAGGLLQREYGANLPQLLQTPFSPSQQTSMVAGTLDLLAAERPPADPVAAAVAAVAATAPAAAGPAAGPTAAANGPDGLRPAAAEVSSIQRAAMAWTQRAMSVQLRPQHVNLADVLGILGGESDEDAPDGTVPEGMQRGPVPAGAASVAHATGGGLSPSAVVVDGGDGQVAAATPALHHAKAPSVQDVLKLVDGLSAGAVSSHGYAVAKGVVV